jgi:hypothetical protein
MDGIPDGAKLVLQKVRGIWYGQLKACVTGPEPGSHDFNPDLDLSPALEEEHFVAAESDDAPQLIQTLVRGWLSCAEHRPNGIGSDLPFVGQYVEGVPANESRCRKCGVMYRWQGDSWLDQPACPACGFRPSEEERRRAEADMREAERRANDLERE